MKKIKSLLAVIVTGLMIATVNPVNASATTTAPKYEINASFASEEVEVSVENPYKSEWCHDEEIVFKLSTDYEDYMPYIALKKKTGDVNYEFFYEKELGCLVARIPVNENGKYSLSLGSSKLIPLTWVGSVSINNIDNGDPTADVKVMPASDSSSAKIHVDASDAESGINKVTLKETGESFGANSCDFVVKKNGNYTIVIEDGAGNWIEKPVKIDTIDDIDPVIKVNVITEGYAKEVEIQITANDEGTGVKKIVDPTTKEEYESDNVIVKVNKNGYYVFEVYDKAGNENNKMIYVDNVIEGDLHYYIEGPTKPMNTLEYSTAGIEIKPYSDSIDAVKCVRKSDGKELPYDVHDGLKYFYDRSIKENGTYEYTLIDKYGREVEFKYEVSCIDNEIPEFRINSGDYVDHSTAAYDVHLSIIPLAKNLGTTKYFYCVNEGEWTLFPGEITISNEGTYSYKFKAQSEAGVESQEKAITVVRTADAASCLSVIGLGLSAMGMGISKRRKRNKK